MTVSPVYWISNSLQAIEDLLVLCPTFATLGMSASNTYWQDVRSGPITAPYCCIVMLDGDESESEANKVTRHSNNIAVYLTWPIDNTEGDSAKDKTKRATNAFGQLLSEIASFIGTTTAVPSAAVRRFEPPTRTNDKDDQDEQAQAWEATINFSWEI